jgi:hypothetical protein
MTTTPTRSAPRTGGRLPTVAEERRSAFLRGLVAGAVASTVLLALVAGTVAAVRAGGDPSANQAARIRAADDGRDVSQVKTLTALARSTQTSLLPVLGQMAAAMPPRGKGRPVPADPTRVRQWKQVTTAALGRYLDPPSGSTSINVARQALTSALRELDTAVGTYGAAVTGPAAQRAQLVALAGEQRDNAIAAWSAGATQLDQVNEAAGFGHAEVDLPVDGSASSEASG